MNLEDISPKELVVLRLALADFKVKVTGNKESITVSKFQSEELFKRFEEQEQVTIQLLQKIERC